MYKRTHHRLTFMFTCITGLVLITMSVLYLYTSMHTQQSNGRLSFSSDMNTLISNCEQQHEITYEWLSKMEANGNYILAAYDKEVALSFNSRSHSAATRALIDELYSYCQTQGYFADGTLYTSSYTSIHHEFSYRAGDHKSYYVCCATIAGYSGNFHILVLSKSLDLLLHQLARQRVAFVILDCFVVLFLFCFCWFFTKKLLLPIEESQRKQTAFVASASHELRTPLAVILTAISACKKADDRQREHFLAVIESEGQQMAALIQDMLTLASADNHSWDIQPAPVELDTLLLNCYESFTSVSAQTQIGLSIELPDENLPACLCDEKRIRQVLTILLHNAFSYGDPGGSISLTLIKTSSHYRIIVADHGRGISDADKPHIFERFYRSTQADTKQEHFGLGLCIAKEIMTAHRGTIAVTDTPGGGSTFTLTLTSSNK